MPLSWNERWNGSVLARASEAVQRRVRWRGPSVPAEPHASAEPANVEPVNVEPVNVNPTRIVPKLFWRRSLPWFNRASPFQTTCTSAPFDCSLRKSRTTSV